MSFVIVDGKQIYYEEYGEKGNQTLVYLHGGPGESCLTYTYQAKIFGEKFHVISFDQYGVFRSEAIPENTPYGVEDHVDLIEKMRIALEVENWVLLGHSFGGMLACLYAYKYPNVTAAVVYDCPMWSTLHTSRTIAETTLPYYTENNAVEQIKLCNEILQEGISAKDAFAKAVSLEMTDELKKYCHVIDDDVYMKYISDHIPQVDVPEQDWYKYIHFTNMLMEKDDFYINYLPCLSKNQKPALLIVGEYDMTCGPDQQEWFIRNSANSKFVCLKDSAHMSWMQKTKEYTDIISEFVKINVGKS